MIQLDGEIEELIERLAPILHFHPNEGDYCCFPSDAEATFAQYGSDWSKFTKDPTPKTLIENTPCYYEVWQENKMIQLRYWFWFRYNSFPGTPLGIGKHIGDWEHIEIRIYPEFKGKQAIIWLLSNHHTARLASKDSSLTLPGFVSEPVQLTDFHAHCWVALGSHANYPSPRSKPYCILRIFCDRIDDGGSVWKTWNNLKDIRDTNFVKYRGRWGDTKAPRSPLNRYNNRWRNVPDVLPLISSDQIDYSMKYIMD